MVGLLAFNDACGSDSSMVIATGCVEGSNVASTWALLLWEVRVFGGIGRKKVASNWGKTES